jgi:MFS family permease
LLALGGVGAALAYAPSLARIAELSTEATRVSGMALAHAAGALGMIVGPLAGAAFDSTFGWLDGSVRASAFLSVVGIVHAMASVVLASRRAPQGVASPLPAGLKEHRRTS